MKFNLVNGSQSCEIVQCQPTLHHGAPGNATAEIACDGLMGENASPPREPELAAENCLELLVGRNSEVTDFYRGYGVAGIFFAAIVVLTYILLFSNGMLS